jgi:hypothetical protein
LISLKNSTINKQIRKKTADLTDRNVITQPIKTVAILNNTTSNLNLKNLKYLEKSLGFESSQFSIFTVKNKRDNYNELRGTVVDKTIFNNFGKIKSEKVDAFLNNKYDLLIDFTNIENNVELFFSLAINANIRVGYKHEKEIYDIMLAIEKGNIQTFSDEMVRYLKILKFLK